MARVTATEVQRIIETSLNLNPFITAANVLVDDVLANEDLSDAVLKQIEMWLSAHFVAIREPVVKSEKTLDAAVTYHGSIGAGATGLEFTPYGQQALLYDSSGKLKQLNKRPATFKVIEHTLE